MDEAMAKDEQMAGTFGLEESDGTERAPFPCERTTPDAGWWVRDALARWDEAYGSCPEAQSFEVQALRALVEGMKELLDRG